MKKMFLNRKNICIFLIREVGESEIFIRNWQNLIIPNENLSMQLSSGDVLQCQKVDASIMRAYQDHRRELILSEKQL